MSPVADLAEIIHSPKTFDAHSKVPIPVDLAASLVCSCRQVVSRERLRISCGGRSVKGTGVGFTPGMLGSMSSVLNRDPVSLCQRSAWKRNSAAFSDGPFGVTGIWVEALCQPVKLRALAVELWRLKCRTCLNGFSIAWQLDKHGISSLGVLLQGR